MSHEYLLSTSRHQLTPPKQQKQISKDDRPADNISFAATNLIKPGLQSRNKQEDSRNVFPPTPPPDNDKPAGGAGQMSRGASVRNGPKPQLAKLNIDTSAGGGSRYEKMSAVSDRRAPSSGIRSNNSTPARGYSRRDNQRRGVRSDEEGEDAYPDELYDMYQGNSNRGSSRNTRRPGQQRYIEEEEDGSDYDDGSFDEGDFEMVSNNPPRRTGTNSTSSRGMSRRPEIRKIRVKVHAEDVRYIMVGTAVEFPDFVDRIRDKFGLRRRFKIKVRDDDMPNGDMITLGDQDDLDMVVMTCKSVARKTRQEIGKMEVSIRPPSRNTRTLTDTLCRSGSRRCRGYYPGQTNHPGKKGEREKGGKRDRRYPSGHRATTSRMCVSVPYNHFFLLFTTS